MYVPSVLDRVRVKGEARMFLVVRVDEANQCADLAPWGEQYRQIQHFPFSIIEFFPTCIVPRPRA
jgi:hypothetical protein